MGFFENLDHDTATRGYFRKLLLQKSPSKALPSRISNVYSVFGMRCGVYQVILRLLFSTAPISSRLRGFLGLTTAPFMEDTVPRKQNTSKQRKDTKDTIRL